MDKSDNAVWDFLPDGHLNLYHIMSFEVINIDTGHVLLRIEWATN